MLVAEDTIINRIVTLSRSYSLVEERRNKFSVCDTVLGILIGEHVGWEVSRLRDQRGYPENVII